MSSKTKTVTTITCDECKVEMTHEKAIKPEPVIVKLNGKDFRVTIGIVGMDRLTDSDYNLCNRCRKNILVIAEKQK